jgi:hypothetical protein
LWLQAADENSALGYIFSSLDKLVDSTVQLISSIFDVRSFTKSWLTSGFWIAYVYLACLLILFLFRALTRAIVEVMARTNAFGLRNAIARERGIAAYHAWLPLERIRPAHVPQQVWEEKFAWPADNRAPDPPRVQRILFGILGYAACIFILLIVLDVFAPSVLTWLGELARKIWS